MAKKHCLSDESLRKFFVEHYFDTSPAKLKSAVTNRETGVTTYIGESKDAEFANIRDVCHARAYSCKYTSVHTSIWTVIPETAEYRHWLLDKEKSPWRSLLKDARFHRRDDGEVVGVSLDNIGPKCLNLVQNFLFATRLHAEFYHAPRWEVFRRAREFGIPMEGAAIMPFMFTPFSDTHLFLYDRFSNWHSPFYRQLNKIPSIKALEEGKPTCKGPDWDPYLRRAVPDSKYPGLINDIWLTPFNEDFAKLDNKAQEILPLYTGVFGAAYAREARKLEIPLRPPAIHDRGNALASTATVSYETLRDHYQKWRV